jgi:hypothetical protein
MLNKLKKREDVLDKHEDVLSKRKRAFQKSLWEVR